MDVNNVGVNRVVREKEQQSDERVQNANQEQVSLFANDTNYTNSDGIELQSNRNELNDNTPADLQQNNKDTQNITSVFKKDDRISKDKDGNKYVAVDLWDNNNNANDCLSRIIVNSYDLKAMGIAMGSDEYFILEKTVMDANPEIYGNDNGGWREELGGTGRRNAVLYDGEKVVLPDFQINKNNSNNENKTKNSENNGQKEPSVPDKSKDKADKPQETSPSSPSSPSSSTPNTNQSQSTTKQKIVDYNKAKETAEKFYSIADDNAGIISASKMKELLDKEVTADNVTAFLDAYDTAKQGDSSIIDTVISETGASKEEQKQVLMAIMDKLEEAAKKAGVSDEDIKKARSEYESSMNKEFNALLRRTNPKDMEKSIDFLRGAIAVKQNAGAELSDSEAIEQFNAGFSSQHETAQKDFTEARENEGWSAKAGDTVLGWFGCNTEDDLKSKLGENAESVKKLANSTSESEFKKNYKEIFGIEFDKNKISARQTAVDKLTTVQNCDNTVKAVDDILTTTGNYSELKAKIQEKLSYDDDTVNQIINSYSQENGKTNPSDDEKKDILLKFLNTAKTSAKERRDAISNGKSIEQMQKDVELITKSTFGTSDIAKDVAQYNENQQLTGTVVEAGAEIAGTIALQFVPGLGQAAAARLAVSAAKWGSKGLKVANAAGKAEKVFSTVNNIQKGNAIANASGKTSKIVNKSAQIGLQMANAGIATMGVDLSNGKSVEEASKKALMNMSFAGVGASSSVLAPRLMQTFGIADKTIANEIAEQIVNMAGVYGITTLSGDEYGSNQALIDFTSGLIMARLSHIKTGQIQGNKATSANNSTGQPNPPRLNGGSTVNKTNTSAKTMNADTHTQNSTTGVNQNNNVNYTNNYNVNPLKTNGANQQNFKAQGMNKSANTSGANNSTPNTKVNSAQSTSSGPKVQNNTNPQNYKKAVQSKLNELYSNPNVKIVKQTMKINGKNSNVEVFKNSQQGSNFGMWIKNSDTDELFYVKFMDSTRRANEELSADLYKLAGVKSPEFKTFDNNGQIGMASKFEPLTPPSANDIAEIRKGFAADCWLANWDALKDGNIMMSGGKPIRSDVGGSLMYRARGSLKGASFGENVNELTSFFNSNSLSKKYINSMTRDELLDSLSNVTSISDTDIAKMVYAKAGKQIPKGGNEIGYIYSGNITNPQFITEMLRERRDYMAKFQSVAKNTPIKNGETIEQYVRRIDSITPKKTYSVDFYGKHMIPSERAIGVNMTLNEAQNHKIGEFLTPSQKQLVSDSYDAFKSQQSNGAIKHAKGNFINSDSMLHRTSGHNLDEILKGGLVSREFTGNIGAVAGGVAVGSRTPMCADLWDVSGNFTIDSYFSNKRQWIDGESNFLPSPGRNYRDSSGLVIVFSKNSVDKKIMDNSFKVATEQSPLHADGNMSGYKSYKSHRAVPVGLPSNSIEKIIVPNGASKYDIQNYIKSIKNSGLDIDLYDIKGNLLFSP